MKFEIFSEGNSSIHQLDPRVKIFSATTLIIIAAVINSFYSIILILLFAILSLFTAKLNIRSVLYRIFFPNILIFTIWIFIPFSTAGHTLFNVFGMNMTLQGIEKALLITIKCNAILLLLISYISTIPAMVVSQAINKMGVNRKLSYILFFFNRYLYVIYSELHKLLDSLKVRGFRPSTNLHTYRTFANLVGILLVRSWERAERIYDAMLCRGFNGHFYSMVEFNSTKRDYVFVSFCLIISIMAIALSCLS